MHKAAFRSKSEMLFQQLFIHYFLLFLLGVGVYVGSLFCYVVLGALSSVAIILLRKRELVSYFNCVVTL